MRLSGREEWGTLLMNATAIIYQFLVPAMIMQDDPRECFRHAYHNERFLRPERRHTVDALLGELVAAFRGIDDGSLDYHKLLQLHERLIGSIWREMRAACQKHNVEYPDEAEQEMREYYREELGVVIPGPMEDIP